MQKGLERPEEPWRVSSRLCFRGGWDLFGAFRQGQTCDLVGFRGYPSYTEGKEQFTGGRRSR